MLRDGLEPRHLPRVDARSAHAFDSLSTEPVRTRGRVYKTKRSATRLEWSGLSSNRCLPQNFGGLRDLYDRLLHFGRRLACGAQKKFSGVWSLCNKRRETEFLPKKVVSSAEKFLAPANACRQPQLRRFFREGPYLNNTTSERFAFKKLSHPEKGLLGSHECLR